MKYPRGVQEKGESPVDIIIPGKELTIRNMAPNGAGCSEIEYVIISACDDTVILAPKDSIVQMSIEDVRRLRIG